MNKPVKISIIYSLGAPYNPRLSHLRKNQLSVEILEFLNGKDSSDFFKLCKKSDPELSTCILNSANEAWPHLKKGIPELKLQQIDPLLIPQIALNQGKDNFKLSLTFNNMTVSGNSDMKLESISADNNINWINSTGFGKLVHMETDYIMDGKVLFLPVKGSGKATFDFYDVSFETYIELEHFTKKGEEYIKCKKILMQMKPKKVKSYLTNLFNGDKTLGENTNKFFNENWEEVYETYREMREEGFSQLFKEYFNRLFTAYPLKDWFLD